MVIVAVSLAADLNNDHFRLHCNKERIDGYQHRQNHIFVIQNFTWSCCHTDMNYDYKHELVAHDLVALTAGSNAMEVGIVVDENVIVLVDSNIHSGSVNLPKNLDER